MERFNSFLDVSYSIKLLLFNVNTPGLADNFTVRKTDFDCPNDQSTLPTAEILSGKNARAWVSMVLYLKK